MAQLQQQQTSNAVVIRASNRKRRPVPGNPLNYEVVSPDSARSLVMFVISAEPGQSTGTNLLTHRGDENLLLLSGRAEVEIENTKHILEAGDSIFIPRGQRHRVTNVGTETARAVFAISPPEY